MFSLVLVGINCEQSPSTDAERPRDVAFLEEAVCQAEKTVAYWTDYRPNARNSKLAAEFNLLQVAARNNCKNQSSIIERGEFDLCKQFDGCDDGVPVEFCHREGSEEPPEHAVRAIGAFFSRFL